MNTEKIEKKRKRNLICQFQTTISRFIAFTILGIFRNFVIKPEALVLCHSIKNSLTCGIYEDQSMRSN